MKITTSDKINELLEEEERTGELLIDLVGEKEKDGLLYTHWRDVRNGADYLVRKERTVHVGFNDTPPEKEEEIKRILESEGVCHASWGVTGRTMHSILAANLAQKMPEYQFEIGSNYKCRITKRQ